MPNKKTVILVMKEYINWLLITTGAIFHFSAMLYLQKFLGLNGAGMFLLISDISIIMAIYPLYIKIIREDVN